MLTSKQIALYQIYVSRSIAVLAGICALAVFLYGVFLMIAVEHTATRTAVQSQVDALTLQLGSLETQYLTESRTLTPEYAAQLGYVTPTQTTAVFTDSDANSLSFK